MKIYFAFVISLLLFCPGEMTEWPTHTLCNTGNFQAFYKSCDPLQDFGVDLSLCSPIAQDLKLRFGVLLRHNIKELFLAITAYFNGQLFLNYDYTICESSAPRFSFCGRKKAGQGNIYAGIALWYKYGIPSPEIRYPDSSKLQEEFIQIDHPIIPHIPVIPKGEFNVSLELHNEDKKFIGCATLMVNSV